MRFRPLLYLSLAASAIYLLTSPLAPFPGRPLVKGCAAGALAVLAFASRGFRRGAGLLALALAFSTAGDVLLDWDAQLFPLGLGAFLLAHIAYVSLFVRRRARDRRIEWLQWMAVLVILMFSISLSFWIVPSVGALAVPVVLYVCALTAMVCTAILGRFRSPWVAVGAILFLISDSLLAVNRFKQPVPLRDFLVWTTYYAGQCGIALGYLASA